MPYETYLVRSRLTTSSAVETIPTVSRIRALVTGGTSGIGAAVVERLRADGADVVFTGRNAGRGAAVARRTGATFVQADTRRSADVLRSVEIAEEKLRGLTAAVLNAGVIHAAPLSETDDDAWDSVLETNLVGPFLYASAVLPPLRAAGGGAIVAVSSDAGAWGETAIGAYSVSKRALDWLVRALAAEAGPAGIRVNAVCPGDTEPGMRSWAHGGVRNEDTSAWPLPPLRRLGRATDVAGAVTFLLSGDAAFVSGVTLLVDGGMRAAYGGGVARL